MTYRFNIRYPDMTAHCTIVEADNLTEALEKMEEIEVPRYIDRGYETFFWHFID